MITLVLFLLTGSAIGQGKIIYCIKHTYYHIHDEENDTIESKFIRTVWFDMCNGATSFSKSWQYNRNSETVSQMLSYTNQLQNQSIDLTWDKETKYKEENCTFHLTSFDSTTHKYFSFYAYVSKNEVRKVDFEMWRMENDSVITEIYQVKNAETIISELQNWMIKDRDSKDSLSIPKFPELMNLQKELFLVKKDTIQSRHINVFKPYANSFKCGDKKTPKYIRKNSKLINRRKKVLCEKRFQIDQDIETIYDIYYISNANSK